jgi:amidase
VPTTSGSKFLAAGAAGRGGRRLPRRGARRRRPIVGKTNLVELAFGADGVNPWFGTPVNPLDAA